MVLRRLRFDVYPVSMQEPPKVGGAFDAKVFYRPYLGGMPDEDVGNRFSSLLFGLTMLIRRSILSLRVMRLEEPLKFEATSLAQPPPAAPFSDVRSPEVYLAYYGLPSGL